MAKKFDTRNTWLNGHPITRVLPRPHLRMIGPFIFIDLMGPLDFAAGEGLDVPPHPHIGLCTLTYLFAGELLHQDSLGNVLVIRPGEVNWMTAGRGITHSERHTQGHRMAPHRLYGLQCWLAMEKEEADSAPDFIHLETASIPCDENSQRSINLIAGAAYEMQSPITSNKALFFIDITARQECELGHPEPQHQALLFVVDAEIKIGEQVFQAGEFALLEKSDLIEARKGARFLILGGKAWPEQPYIDWNFVGFDKARIEKAKSDWREGRFRQIPGDHEEFIALPE
jgi:redox-sensitive bicupin YhaK (pirin superfamily)